MSTPAASNVIRLVRTRGLCVLRQLRLEETLFRANDENWAIVNDGAPRRAIVLGISGKPHRLIDVAAAHEDDVLVIKRFTGGGTVVVDADTQFVSLVMNGDAIPNVPLFPRPLMRWTGDLYGGVVGTNDDTGVFRDLPNWRLHQDDYVVETRSELASNDRDDRVDRVEKNRVDRVDRATAVSRSKTFLKVGGNAQSISKTRFVHHTSFLWDFDVATMKKYLAVPDKATGVPGKPSARSVPRAAVAMDGGPKRASRSVAGRAARARLGRPRSLAGGRRGGGARG